MAKKPTKTQIELLKKIGAGGVYVSQAEGKPLVDAGLIEVNTAMTDPNDASKVAARLTEAGTAAVSGGGSASSDAGAAATPQIEIVSGFEAPPSKRGNRSGAPSQYPFDRLEVGQSFFVAASEKHPEPAKSLGSSVSAANARYAQDTGRTEQKERTKRGPGNKAVKDANGNNVRETVTVPVKEFTRHFTIRPVEAGKTYGSWTAKENGAMIIRDK